jgi:hypothetical protein
MRTRWLDDEGDPLPPSRVTRLDLAVLLLHSLANVVGEAARVIDGFKVITQQHNNYLVELEEFSVDVSLAIETMTEGVEEDG